jgi:hypothetical protein
MQRTPYCRTGRPCCKGCVEVKHCTACTCTVYTCSPPVTPCVHTVWYIVPVWLCYYGGKTGARCSPRGTSLPSHSLPPCGPSPPTCLCHIDTHTRTHNHLPVRYAMRTQYSIVYILSRCDVSALSVHPFLPARSAMHTHCAHTVQSGVSGRQCLTPRKPNGPGSLTCPCSSAPLQTCH